MIIERTLRNGIRVVLKHSPHFNSVSMGVFTLVGLPQEPENLTGISHFLEHMSFKGTHKYSAKKMAQVVDEMGGRINAHTAKEYTCYTLTVMPRHLKRGLQILADLYINAKLEEADIQTERKVVLEEIKMYEDTPDEKIHDNFFSTVWPTSQLGRPIIGYKSHLDAINQDSLRQFKQHYFNGKNMIISLAGNIRHAEKVIQYIEQLFVLPDSTQPDYLSFGQSPKPVSKIHVESKKIEQVHFCLGGQGYAYNHPDHFSLSVLSTILGGSMSSRLFQKIREKKGWAYSVCSYLSFFRDAGLFTVYAGINPSKLDACIHIIQDELDQLCTKPVSKSELYKAKENIKGNFSMSLEKSSSWMSWMGRSIMYFDKVVSIDELLGKVNAVGQADVQKVAQGVLTTPQFSLAVLGPASHVPKSWHGQSVSDVLGGLT